MQRTSWLTCKPAAFDLTVVSKLNSETLNKVGATGASAAGNAEAHKHMANNQKCRELGWIYIPLAIETYGCWGVISHETGPPSNHHHLISLPYTTFHIYFPFNYTQLLHICIPQVSLVYKMILYSNLLCNLLCIIDASTCNKKQCRFCI